MLETREIIYIYFHFHSKTQKHSQQTKAVSYREINAAHSHTDNVKKKLHRIARIQMIPVGEAARVYTNVSVISQPPLSYFG